MRQFFGRKTHHWLGEALPGWLPAGAALLSALAFALRAARSPLTESALSELLLLSPPDDSASLESDDDEVTEELSLLLELIVSLLLSSASAAAFISSSLWGVDELTAFFDFFFAKCFAYFFRLSHITKLSLSFIWTAFW